MQVEHRKSDRKDAAPSEEGWCPGVVFVDRKSGRHRRVIAVLGGYVVYSVGGDSNRQCMVSTMTRWIRRQGVHIVHVPKGE